MKKFYYIGISIIWILFVQNVHATHQVEYRVPTSIVTTVGELTTVQIDVKNAGSTSEYYQITMMATSPNEMQITNPTITTETLVPDGTTSLFTNIQTLTEKDNAITIQIYRDNDLSHFYQPQPVILVKSKKLSLPEFGLTGFLQIIAIAAVVYFLFAKSRKI